MADARADIIIDGYTDATNDRFSNSRSFILDGFDLSGIGQAANGQWATAISRQVIVTAEHARPSGTVYFYPGNDPTVAPVKRTISKGTKLTSADGTSDLYLAALSAPLPLSIAHYAYATERLLAAVTGFPLNVEDAGSFQGLNAYTFGITPFNLASDPNRSRRNAQAVGRNLITGYSENVPFEGNGDNDALIFEQDAAGAANFVPYESMLDRGDSGAPLFVDIGGQLVLLGTNAFNYGSGTGVADFITGGFGSGINYIGNGEAFISAFISSVPEPSSGASVAVVVLLSLSLCRRRQL